MAKNNPELGAWKQQEKWRKENQANGLSNTSKPVYAIHLRFPVLHQLELMVRDEVPITPRVDYYISEEMRQYYFL